MLKRSLSFILCVLMIASSFIATGTIVSANNEIADEIMMQLHSESALETPKISGDEPDVDENTVSANSEVNISDDVNGVYSGTCGDNLTWSLYTSTGVLTIEGTGNMTDYTYYNTYDTTAPWGDYDSYIKSVVIGDSVTSIGDYAFYRCTTLKSVTVPDSVTSIGDYAFYYCISLKSVTIPDSVTSIGVYAFHKENYEYYTPLDLTVNCNENSYAHTYSVDNGLTCCLLDIDIILGKCGDDLTWNFDPVSGVLDITGTGKMGYYYLEPAPWYSFRSSIKKVIIGDSVTSIGHSAFTGCNSLNEVVIPASVTRIDDDAFWGCTNLTGVYITDIERWCNLDFDYTYFDPAMENECNSNPLRYAKNLYINGELVRELVIPDTVERISAYAFYNCSSLTDVVIPDSVTYIELYAFLGCDSLENINISDSVTTIGRGAFYDTAYFSNETNWENDVLYISDHLISAKNTLQGVYKVKEGTICIADRAFTHCMYLTDVIIPDSVKTIGYEAFTYCESLTTAVIGDSVTKIGERAFNGCQYLESVTVGKSVMSIGHYSFDGCQSVVIQCYENSYTHNYAINRILSFEFLTPETVSGKISDTLTWTFNISIGALSINGIGYMYDYSAQKSPWYEYTSEIKSVVIGDSVKNIGAYAFYNCTSLTDIEIPCSVIAIGDRAFYGCSSLSEITFPDSVMEVGGAVVTGSAYYNNKDNWTDKVLYAGNHLVAADASIEGIYCIRQGTRTISGAAFWGCDALAGVVIPSSVVSIGWYTFYGCGSLNSAVIPRSVENIGGYAFAESPVTISCCENSYAQSYAINNGIDYIIFDDHIHSYTEDILRTPTCSVTGIGMYLCVCGDYYTTVLPTVEHKYDNYVYNNDSTCTSDGTSTAYCSYGCGTVDTVIEEGTKHPHLFSEYIYNGDGNCEYPGTMTAYCNYNCGTSDTKPADSDMYGHIFKYEVIESSTCTAEGMMLYICKCGMYYTESIPVIPHMYTDYTYNNDATCVDLGTKTAYCDYGCGTSDTVTAEGVYADHDFVCIVYEPASCIITGYYGYACKNCSEYIVVSIERPDHIYTKWTVIKEPTYTEPGIERSICDTCTLCETEREIPMLVGTPEPYLTSDGVQLTVNELYNVKDYFIAEGDYDTYREVKNNMVFSITAAKIGENTSYTYMVKNHGIHTVYIRYNDGSAKVLKTEITGVEPEFSVNGLQLTVTNLENIRVIRTAYGEYDRAGLMKRDVTHRAFTAKGEIKGVDEYKIQYRDEGRVTVAVIYNDGYEEYYVYDVVQKRPAMTQEGNTVVFGNLDGLYNIRYAKGEYNTSAQIKAAAGSVALKPSKIDENGNITVKLTTAGTYTFCVQYDDESFNYYRIVVE